MKSIIQATLSNEFTFIRVAIIIRLLLRVFILNDASLPFSSLLLERVASNTLGDLGHVEGVLRNPELHRLGNLQLAWDKITFSILDKDDFTLQLLLLLPHLLVGLNETILVVLYFLQLLLAISDLDPLSLFGLGTGNILRKPSFAGG
jgi:hypothetical protein